MTVADKQTNNDNGACATSNSLILTQRSGLQLLLDLIALGFNNKFHHEFMFMTTLPLHHLGESSPLFHSLRHCLGTFGNYCKLCVPTARNPVVLLRFSHFPTCLISYSPPLLGECQPMPMNPRASSQRIIGLELQPLHILEAG